MWLASKPQGFTLNLLQQNTGHEKMAIRVREECVHENVHHEHTHCERQRSSHTTENREYQNEKSEEMKN